MKEKGTSQLLFFFLRGGYGIFAFFFSLFLSLSVWREEGLPLSLRVGGFFFSSGYGL